MADHSSLIAWLKYSGARKVDGTTVSSGRAWFYQPGTVSTQVEVYSNEAGSVATQPVALDAAGRATVYTRLPVNIVVEEAVTHVVVSTSERSNTLTAHQVDMLASDYFPVGLSVASALDRLAQGVDYKESAVAGFIPYQYAIGGGELTLQDFGAIGDGIADDTAAILLCLARQVQSKKRIRVNPGTYNFSTSLVITNPGAHIYGVNNQSCIFRNTGSQFGFYIWQASGPDCGVVLENFSITHASTNPNAAVFTAGGDGAVIRNLRIRNHRIGIDSTGVGSTSIEDVVVHSTDGNVNGAGIMVGPGATALRSRVLSAGAGKGIMVSFQARAVQCSAESCAVGFEVYAPGAQVILGYAVNCTTGYLHTSSDTHIAMSVANVCTTGFSIGAVVRAGQSFCSSTNAGPDIFTSAGASEVIDNGNTFTTRTLNDYGGNSIMGARGRVLQRALTVNNATGAVSWVPDLRLGELQHFQHNAASATDLDLTIGAPVATGAQNGQLLTLYLAANNSGGGVINLTWNAVFNGSGAFFAAPTSGHHSSWTFYRSGGDWKLIAVVNDCIGA